ncbi:hypothetical protein ACLOJK_001080 [Asimina triloba]
MDKKTKETVEDVKGSIVGRWIRGLALDIWMMMSTSFLDDVDGRMARIYVPRGQQQHRHRTHQFCSPPI